MRNHDGYIVEGEGSVYFAEVNKKKSRPSLRS